MKICSITDTKETGVSHNPRIRKKVLVANGEIAHVTYFSKAVFPPGEKASAHYHGDMTEVFFVESGEGIISVNEEHVPFGAGVCITVEPNEMHELRNTGSTDLVILYFGINT